MVVLGGQETAKEKASFIPELGLITALFIFSSSIMKNERKITYNLMR